MALLKSHDINMHRGSMTQSSDNFQKIAFFMRYVGASRGFFINFVE